MAEDIQLQWRVTSMDCYPNFSGAKDYVFNVHWDCLTYYSGISGGPLYGRTYSVTEVPTNTGEFTPYTGLTEPMVLSWVWNVMGSGSKYNYEQISLSQIYNQLVPPVVQPPIPWVPDVFPVIAPQITIQPSDLNIWSGQSAIFSVSCVGQPLNYQWSKNGESIISGTNQFLTLNDVQVDQSGTYNVEIFNSLGTVKSSGATLIVNAPVEPVITVEPSGASIVSGSFYALNVFATGYPNPYYQWQKNGTELSGKCQSMLMFNIVQPEDAGDYNVVVSNVVGSKTSQTATVIVTDSTPVTGDII